VPHRARAGGALQARFVSSRLSSILQTEPHTAEACKHPASGCMRLERVQQATQMGMGWSERKVRHACMQARCCLAPTQKQSRWAWAGAVPRN
jgi:hypothetical protein